MLSKNQISQVVALHQKKFRKAENMFIAEGEKVVTDLLQSSFDVKKIFATSSFIERYHKRFQKKSVSEWVEVTESELNKISSLNTPNQVVALAAIPSYQFDKSSIQNKLNLVLDDISDPGNLGTIIRIADWFGIENIICSTDTADCYNPKVVQASMGSLFRIKIHYMNLENFLAENKSSNIYGTTLDGENIYSAKLSHEGFIVVGSESTGISTEIKNYLTHKVYIPDFNLKAGKNQPDSLNAAVATAIVCAEFRRRQQAK